MLGRDCWFCNQGEDVEPLALDREFDTPVHLSCIKERLANPEKYPGAVDEAEIMKYLIIDLEGKPNDETK